MARSEAWHKYQRDTAELFRALGLNAVVDARVEGARARHDTDVLVTFQSFGIDHCWIVECKLWKRRVNNAAVLAFDGIVKDVGADFGFLLTESGAQSGAITATRFSNVRITNLEDLRSNVQGGLRDLRWSEIFTRSAELDHLLASLWATVIDGGVSSGSTATLKPGVDWDELMEMRGRLSAVETGIARARLTRFPAPFDLDVINMRYLGADDMAAFVQGAAQTLDTIEPWVREQAPRRLASEDFVVARATNGIPDQPPSLRQETTPSSSVHDGSGSESSIRFSTSSRASCLALVGVEASTHTRANILCPSAGRPSNIGSAADQSVNSS
jgi:Restriction endonuclease